MMNSPATNRAGLRAKGAATRNGILRPRARTPETPVCRRVATRDVFEIGALFALVIVIKTRRARAGGRDNACVSNRYVS
jgi:hypothetical protein